MIFSAAGVTCTSLAIDTRVLEPGACFVALPGENVDGHDYVAKAFEKGAAAAVVARRVEAAGPQEVVADPLAWLQQTASEARARFAGPVVAITGSAGKTTTKEALAALLETRFRTGKTSGNYNNHIGVPFSILNLPEEAEAAVLEIGMNHTGEIRALAALARPTVAVVTNSGSAHIENLGSLEAIARAKRELVEALPETGIAVLNADDARVRAMAEAAPGRVVYYGTTEFVPSEAAHVRASNVEYFPEGSRFEVPGVGSFFCPLAGRGGLMAALAALATARALGLDAENLKDALAAIVPPKMRLSRSMHRGVTVWDDCYNSNPEAAVMMLDLLAATPAARRIAVLGEMRELGSFSEELHREVGRHAAACVDLLIAVRGDARHLAQAALEGGLPPANALFFDEPGLAGAALRGLAQAGDAVLFKGSRGTRIELALQEFLA